MPQSAPGDCRYHQVASERSPASYPSTHALLLATWETAPDNRSPLPVSPAMRRSYLSPLWPRHTRQRLLLRPPAPGALSLSPAVLRGSAADRTLSHQMPDLADRPRI